MGHPLLRGRVVTEAPKHGVVPVLGWAQLGPLKLEKCRGWGEVVRSGEERGCDSGEALVSQETFLDTTLCPSSDPTPPTRSTYQNHRHN